MSVKRTPHDGKPYYCAKCGAGFGEFLACDEPDCVLENEEIAQERAKEKENE